MVGFARARGDDPSRPRRDRTPHDGSHVIEQEPQEDEDRRDTEQPGDSVLHGSLLAGLVLAFTVCCVSSASARPNGSDPTKQPGQCIVAIRIGSRLTCMTAALYSDEPGPLTRRVGTGRATSRTARSTRSGAGAPK